MKGVLLKFILVFFLVVVVSGVIFPLIMFRQQPVSTTKFLNMVSASVRIQGCGSGVFIDDNVVLTAAHVLKGEGTLRIELYDGTILESGDFYIDTEEDVGFIFVDANEVGIAEVVQSPVAIGDTVYLVGTPHSKFFQFTLTKGILSHLNRDLPEMGWGDLLQTDAEGGYGSSGGPLYNSEGDVVGIYVGHNGDGGLGISLCENAQSILETYERAKECRKQLQPLAI